jgi:hypothetical protein
VLLDLAHGLHDDEGVPGTRLPHASSARRGLRLLGEPGGQDSHQLSRLGPGQCIEREPAERALALDLGKHQSQRGRVLDVFVTEGGNHQHGPAIEAARQKGGQPQAHLIRPVDVLQREQHRLPFGQALEEIAQRLEEPRMCLGRNRRRARWIAKLGSARRGDPGRPVAGAPGRACQALPRASCCGPTQAGGLPSPSIPD